MSKCNCEQCNSPIKTHYFEITLEIDATTFEEAKDIVESMMCKATRKAGTDWNWKY